jgi:hypothetical protein
MAEKSSIKKVDRDALMQGIYRATFTTLGQIEYDFNPLFPNLKELSEVQRGFIVYGVKQKLDDSMAGAADEKEAYEELASTIGALQQGKWTLRVAGEGGGEAGGLFARAYAEFKGVSLADAKAKIADVVKKNQEQNPKSSERSIVNGIRATYLQGKPEFAAIYQRMQQERATKVSSKVKTNVTELD